MATQICQQLLKSNARHEEAHMVMGLIAGHHGHTNAAMRAFEMVIDVNDDRLEAHSQLARCLVLRGSHAKAEIHADKVAESNTQQAKLLDLVATVYSHIGKQEKALALYERCLLVEPKNINYLSNAASCLTFLGRISRAQNCLSKAIELQPSNPRFHWQYAKLVTATNNNHIETMISLFQEETILNSQSAQTMLHFAIGKSYEDLRQWPQAWNHYERGNHIERSGLSYNVDDDLDLFDALINTFTKDWIEAHRSKLSAEPIFIIGLPRSGTTLVERIISSHSRVQSLGELPQFPIETKKLSGDRSKQLIHPSMIDSLADIDAARLGSNYLSEVSYLRNEKSLFTDKLPQNYLYIGLLAAAFPQAKFVCLQRNPMDSCFSLYKQLFANAYPFSYDQKELGAYYLGFNKLVKHWRQVLPRQFYTINYEDLVENQEAITRKVLSQLNLDFERECLNFEQNTSAAATASASQVRTKINANSIERWKHFKTELAPLKELISEGEQAQ